ncbi:phosphatase PAP2 family protein [Reichenbachiella sp. MSK19-1]|uniref:phosphatase PAP2 family protein n=1 Tax=Reichenbachiella sp. MSK19-1 TaxID=1897631 RepID=UPI000E6BA71C|nr:phosphatase PAP2 family protein [Reichenbachiella sp. MSK19-1]RJE70460.1 hypothetical protein BGP76_10235 [Reichenbachiella sp. MSK19-1]
MPDFPLGLDALKAIAEYRTEFWILILHTFTLIGDKEGYILIIVGVYMMYDKKLALRLAVIVLSTTIINQILKMIIANPRPFVLEGTYLKHWEVSHSYAEVTAMEFSTPSGHAMASVPFFGYLHHTYHNLHFRIIALAFILLIGFSRPYLGVHYLEDIILGWGFGGLILAIVLKYEEEVCQHWNKLSLFQISLTSIGVSLLFWLTTLLIKDANITNLPTAFTGSLGFIFGILIGARLEKTTLGFDPKSKSIVIKLIRTLLTMALIVAPIVLLKKLPFIDWTDNSYINHLLQYIRYTISALSGIYIAPWLSIKLKLLS